MVTLSGTIVSLLLASCTLAAPLTTVRNRLGKRGFRSTARHYVPKHPVAKRQSGGEATANTNGGGWILDVQIGGQVVKLNVDTGSSDLWTASTLLSSDQQSLVSTGLFYDPTQSSTFQWMNGSQYEIGYADNSGSSGPVGKDTVVIGSASVPNMPFGVCNDLHLGDGQTSRDTDGPVGLGFGSFNSIRPQPQCTFMECLEPYVSDPVFASAFRLDDSGFMDFGYSDPSASSGDATFVDIDNSSGQWIAQGVQFGSGGSVFSPAAMGMDFDSGTTSLNIPDDAASEYFALIDGSSNASGSWTYPCGTDLPDFDFVFTQATSGPQTVTIPGNNLKNGDADSGDCSTWIGSGNDVANAGLPFYIAKYMVWNQANPSLSFADQA